MRYKNTVTQEGVTKSQPGVSVSVRTGTGIKPTLSVSRNYPNLVNEYGGKGRIKKLNYDGKEFDTSEQAWQFALERGYIRPYFKKANKI